MMFMTPDFENRWYQTELPKISARWRPEVSPKEQLDAVFETYISGGHLAKKRILGTYVYGKEFGNLKRRMFGCLGGFGNQIFLFAHVEVMQTRQKS
jgi:hypothetical protein